MGRESFIRRERRQACGSRRVRGGNRRDGLTAAMALLAALALMASALMPSAAMAADGAVSSAAQARAANTAPAAPTGLRVNLLEAPMNVEYRQEDPLLTWIFNDADNNEAETAYQLQVRAGGDEAYGEPVYDSGWTDHGNAVVDGVAMPASAQALVPGDALSGNSLYAWRVRAKDKDGAESPWSEEARFVTAMGGNGIDETFADGSGWASLDTMWLEPKSEIEAWTDYTLETDVTITASALAVMFRAASDSQWYAWQFRADGSISPLYQNGGSAAAFGGSYNVSADELRAKGIVLEANKTFRTRIAVTGANPVRVQVWVDMNPGSGDFVLAQDVEIASQLIPSGSVGFRTGGSERGWADNMVVTAIEQDAGSGTAQALTLYENDFSEPTTAFGSRGTVSDGVLNIANGGVSRYSPPNAEAARFVFFRREFDVSPEEFANMDRAVLAIAGRGTENNRLKSYYMDFYLNGSTVGVGPSRDPLNSSGSASIGRYYNSFDVTGAMTQGTNVLAFSAYSFSERTALAQLTLFGKDGSKKVMVSSGQDMGSWLAKDGTLAFGNANGASFSAGGYITQPNENMDGRHYPAGWNEPGYVTDASWRAPSQTGGMSLTETSRLIPYRAENMLRYYEPAVSREVVAGEPTQINPGAVTVDRGVNSPEREVPGTWHFGGSGWTSYAADHWNSTDGGWCEFTFEGTSVSLFGNRAGDKVNAQEYVVTLDGARVEDGENGASLLSLNGQSAGNFMFASIPGLPDGKHTVRVAIAKQPDTAANVGLSITKAEYANARSETIPGKRFVVYDLGKEIVGGLQIKATNPTDRPLTLTVQQGESLIKPSDVVNASPQTNYDAANAPYGTVRYDGWNDVPVYTETWTLAPGENVLSTMLMKNWRWVQFVNPPEEIDIPAEGVVGMPVRQAFDDADAAVDSDSAFMQRLVELCRYSIKATNQDQYTDSQARERRAYEGDLILNQFNSYAVSDDYALARHTNQYLVDYPTWPPEYRLFSVEMAWADYLWTGDDALIAANYEELKSKLPGESGGGGANTAFNETFGLVRDNHTAQSRGAIVDWPAAEQDGYRRSGGSNASNALSTQTGSFTTVFNSVAYGAYLDMASIADALGHAGDAALYRERAAVIKQSLIDRLYDETDGGFHDSVSEDGVSSHKAQHATFYALAYGIFDSQEMADSMTDYLRRDISERGLTSSVYATYFLLRGLYAAGAGDLAGDIMLEEDPSVVRSWAHMLDVQQATITTEAWSPRNKPNMTYSHPWGGTPGTLITQGIFGIMPVEPGFNLFTVKFQPGNKLGRASISSPSSKGPIGAAFDLETGVYSVSVPANSRAVVSLPSGGETGAWANGAWLPAALGDDGYLTFELGSGSYDIVCQGDAEVGVRVAATTDFGDEAVYELEARYLHAANLVEVVISADAGKLDAASAQVEGLNGFEAFDGPVFGEPVNGRARAKLVLGAYTGTTVSGELVGLAKLSFACKSLGDAGVAIESVKVFGIDGVDGALASIERPSGAKPASAATKIVSAYDVNGDSRVDMADLSLAFYYYQSREGDANWAAASAADVDGSGVVEMTDLLAVYANFIK